MRRSPGRGPLPEGAAIRPGDFVGDPRHIVLLVVPRTSLLEVAGPAEVFSLVAIKLREAGRNRARPYQIHLVSAREPPLEPGITGVHLPTECTYAAFDKPIDTLLVVGGIDVWEEPPDERLRAWLMKQAATTRRYGSICTGAFLLAACGILDGQRVTTHWYFCERLARDFPLLTVDPDPIFIREGRLVTAAGVTSGIDLALAMVAEDVGIDIAARVARGLVIPMRRPGWMPQQSSVLVSAETSSLPFRDLPFWIVENLSADLSVGALSDRASMSPRKFARRFVAEFGTAPGQFVAAMRAETALRMMEDTTLGREQIADAVGFGSVDALERAVGTYQRRAR